MKPRDVLRTIGALTMVTAICTPAGWAGVAVSAGPADLKTVFEGALRSDVEPYEAIIEGDFAAYTRRTVHVRNDAEVRVAVTTLQRFQKPGCKRLRAVISVPEARWTTATGAEESFRYTYEMNLCLDGSPPEETLTPGSTTSPTSKPTSTSTSTPHSNQGPAPAARGGQAQMRTQPGR